MPKDYKTDYDWTDLTDEPVRDCYLCENKLTSVGNTGIYGHNPVVKGVTDYRVCDDCNNEIVIPERENQKNAKRFKYLIGDPETNRKLN